MGGIPTPPTPQPLGLGGSTSVRGQGFPYPQTITGQVAEGLDAFVRNFTSARRGEMDYHKNRFYEQLSMIQQGLLTPTSADYKKILREAKLGGIPIKTEASPEEQQALYQQKIQDSAAAQAAIRSPFAALGQPAPAMTGGTPAMGMPGQAMPGFRALPTQGTVLPGLPAQPIGGGLPNDAALNAVLTSGLQGPNPTPYAPTPATLAQRGLMQRILNPAGNVSLASPGGQWLQRFAEASQTGAPMSPANVQQRGELGNLTQTLQRQGLMDQSGQLTLNAQHRQILASLMNPNDAKHDEAASVALRMGILPALPQNVIEDMVRQSGGSPQDAAKMMMWKEFGLPMAQMKFGLAEKSVNRFNGNYGAALQYWGDMLDRGYSTISPGMTMEEAKQRSDIGVDIMRYTGAPSNVAMTYADIMTDPALAKYKPQFEQLLSKFPTTQQFEQTTKFPWERTARQWEINNDTGRLINAQDNTSLNILDAASRANNTEYNRIYGQLQDRVKANGWDEGSVALLGQLGAVDMKGAQIKYPIKRPDGSVFQYPMQDPQGTVQGAIHWTAQHHLTNVPPYLGAPPEQAPGQQKPPAQMPSSTTTVQVPGAPPPGAMMQGINPSPMFQNTPWNKEAQDILNAEHSAYAAPIMQQMGAFTPVQSMPQQGQPPDGQPQQ